MVPAPVAVVVAAVAVAALVVVAAPPVPSGRRLRQMSPRAAEGRPPEHARSPDTRLPTPMILDLVAQVLASGASTPRALAAVAHCLDRAGDPAAPGLRAHAARLQAGHGSRPAPLLASSGPGPERTAEVDHELTSALELSAATGAGPVALIRAAADERRRRTQGRRARAAQRLGVLVLLPTGLCLLPAFMLLTVVPLVIDLLLR